MSVAGSLQVVGVSVAGSLQVAGLEILGVRAYDPVSRGFISPDPLTSPVGAGWASNVYAFVGNDPVGLVDPWGLSPWVTPLRQNYVSGSTVENIAGFGLDRVGDYALGVANYVVTPQENSLNITDAGKEGLKSMLSGGSSGVSSSSADAIRPATPLRNE